MLKRSDEAAFISLVRLEENALDAPLLTLVAEADKPVAIGRKHVLDDGAGSSRFVSREQAFVRLEVVPGPKGALVCPFCLFLESIDIDLEGAVGVRLTANSGNPTGVCNVPMIPWIGLPVPRVLLLGRAGRWRVGVAGARRAPAIAAGVAHPAAPTAKRGISAHGPRGLVGTCQ